MTLRIHGGTASGPAPPPPETYGPTDGRQAIIDNAGPRGSVTDPGGTRTVLSPSNPVATNQALINLATNVIWWPKGTYTMTTTGYSIPANKVNYLETGPLRTATDTALLTMSGVAAGNNAVTVSGSNVQWHGGIIHGGNTGIICSSGGIADNFLMEDAEIRNAAVKCYAMNGAFDGSNDLTNVTVRYCVFHDGGQYNAHPFEYAGLIWERNESYNGNRLHFEGNPPPNRGPNDEGSAKFLQITGMIYRYNYVHDNDGSEWFDTAVDNCTVQESVFENNQMTGFFCEANSGVTITRNYFKDNMVTGAGGDYTFGPYAHNLNISRSPNTTVTNNDFLITPAVTYTEVGDIMVRYQSSGTLTGLRVTTNRFRRTKAATALGGFITQHNAQVQGAYQTSDNRYDSNEYHVLTSESGSNHFNRAGDGDRTWTQWQAGNSLPYAPGSFYDPAGTFTADL